MCASSVIRTEPVKFKVLDTDSFGEYHAEHSCGMPKTAHTKIKAAHLLSQKIRHAMHKRMLGRHGAAQTMCWMAMNAPEWSGAAKIKICQNLFLLLSRIRAQQCAAACSVNVAGSTLRYAARRVAENCTRRSDIRHSVTRLLCL